MDKQALLSICAAIIFLFGIGYIGYVPGQSDFLQIIIPYAFCFVVYGYAIKNDNTFGTLPFIIGVGIVARFLLLFAFPNLSDDIYRFLWDGYLLHDGISPFENIPSKILHTSQTPGISENLYLLLNSPEYFTVYPTFSQLVFYVSSSVSNSNWVWCACLMKAILFLFEVINIYLIIAILKKLHLPIRRSILYILNPLVIVEIMGNLHYEGMMLTGMLGFYYLYLKNKLPVAAIAFAFGVGTKLIPILYLPALFLARIKIRFWVVLGLSTLVILLPIALSLSNFGSSLDLYFRSFEYNASIYYIVRRIGYNILGYNGIHLIGPLLAGLTVVSVLAFLYKWKDRITAASLPYFLLWSHVIFLALATTVHPWYLILPLAWSILTNYRFIVVWTGLICLTYINYSYVPYHENLVIVAIEYILVVLYFIKYERNKTIEIKKLNPQM